MYTHSHGLYYIYTYIHTYIHTYTYYIDTLSWLILCFAYTHTCVCAYMLLDRQAHICVYMYMYVCVLLDRQVLMLTDISPWFI